MALYRHLFFTILSIAIAVMGAIPGGSSGLRYWVGDSVWSIPPYPNYYADWSSSHFFRTGDSLVFNFETEFYNLMQVPILDYQNCTANSPIKVLKAGPAIILLNEPGVFYFLCNLSNFCDLGQKISITVHDKSFSPTPAPAPAPSSVLSAPPPSPLSSPEPSPGNLNVSECPGPATSGEAPSPADLDLHTGSCGRSSSIRIGFGWLLLCYFLSIVG